LRPKIVPLTNGFFYGKAIKIRFFAEQKSCKSCLSQFTPKSRGNLGGLSCLPQFILISRGELGVQKRHFAKQNIKKYACHFFIGKPFEFELVPEFEF
jgi:hypothetical protein